MKGFGFYLYLAGMSYFNTYPSSFFQGAFKFYDVSYYYSWSDSPTVITYALN